MKLPRAVDRLKRAVKLAPTDERILNNLGLALCRLGKFQDAYNISRAAAGPLTEISIQPGSREVGRDDDAIKLLQELADCPEFHSILQTSHDLYKRTGRTDQSQLEVIR